MCIEDHYEINLIWKESHPLLIDNKYGSVGSFINSFKNLRHTNKSEADDNIIHEQRANKIIEKREVEEVNKTATKRVFYLPYRPVIWKSAETTEKRAVCNASARACQTSTSLMVCMETGLPLQNRLWNILLRSRLDLYYFVVT